MTDLEQVRAALELAADAQSHLPPTAAAPFAAKAIAALPALDRLASAGQHAAAVLRAAKAVSDFYVNGGNGPAREMDAKSEGLLVALTEAVETWEGKS